MQALDSVLFVFINQSLSNPVFDIIMPALTHRGYLLIIPYLVVLFYFTHKSTPKILKPFYITILIAIISVILADLTGGWLKNLIQRQRPCISIESTHLLVGCTLSGSMPSNHSANAFAYAVSLSLFAKRLNRAWLTAFPLCIASLVAISRVFVGVHYPSDIAVGAIIGTTYAVLLYCAVLSPRHLIKFVK